MTERFIGYSGVFGDIGKSVYLHNDKSAYSMRRFFLSVLLLSAFCLPSVGQILRIEKNGETSDSRGGVGDLLFLYRNIYGRYPGDKDVLLDFLWEKSDYEDVAFGQDSLVTRYLAMRDRALVEQIKDRGNIYTVSGDTCSFFIAKEKYTIQCMGDAAALQKYDYDLFRSWIRSRAYDKDGKHIWPFDAEPPMMPREVNRQFRYVVTMEPRARHERHDFVIINWELETEPVLIAITMTRNGTIRYEMPRLEGVQLYYHELGKSYLLENALGTITIEKAIDPDRLDAVKAYLKDFMDQHKEVDRIKTWEMVLFNNPPESSQDSTLPAPSDSVMVIVDGIISPVLFKNNPVPPLEWALQVCPFLSEGDIDTVHLITAGEVSSRIILCNKPRDILLITTRKESALHDYLLNGKPVHKRKGIAPGYLLDRKHLLSNIKKKWGINPNRIEKLEVEGKTIRITTK